mmetsp:Transcript_17158/g.48226  ORF Transcript_17158/g.48226 Transcript_17158/m.48226 type:complete len:300 (+) Transcript_17158:548-1447(+)
MFWKKLFNRKNSGSSASEKDVKKKGKAASGPGATSVPGGSTVFRVTVPDTVKPGEEFQVYAGNRIVRVRCPLDSKPGQSLQITVPNDPAPPGNGAGNAPSKGNDIPPDSDNVQKINDNSGAYMVTIPEGVASEEQFPVTINGQQLMVTCPPGAQPGMSVRIVPPPTTTDITRPPDMTSPLNRNTSMQSEQSFGSSSQGNGTANGSGRPAAPSSGNSPADSNGSSNNTQLFEVQVPNGVNPGTPFALMAGGVRVLVTCPTNAGPGQRFRFRMPEAWLEQAQQPKKYVALCHRQVDSGVDR